MGRAEGNIMWPTPRCMTGGACENGSKHSDLVSVVADNHNWRTPCASDGEGGVKTRDSIEGDSQPKIKLRDHVNHNISRTSSAKLNPSWVEQLMGLPVGWSQVAEGAGSANRVDRLRLLGNGVVPVTATKALTTLLGRFEND